jgi:hypothetical protein
VFGALLVGCVASRVHGGAHTHPRCCDLGVAALCRAWRGGLFHTQQLVQRFTNLAVIGGCVCWMVWSALLVGPGPPSLDGACIIQSRLGCVCAISRGRDPTASVLCSSLLVSPRRVWQSVASVQLTQHPFVRCVLRMRVACARVHSPSVSRCPATAWRVCPLQFRCVCTASVPSASPWVQRMCCSSTAVPLAPGACVRACVRGREAH